MSLPEFATLALSEPRAHVTQITLNRPEVANAFNTQMARDLVDCFEQLSLTHNASRAIILTGAGTRAFCAGGDLKERLDMEDQAWFAQHLIYERMARAVLSCPIPIIAAVNGAAFGGGCELVAASDFAYAVPGAKLALTEVTLGIIPGAGGTQTLPRAIGERRAKELVLTGRIFTAAEALSWGLINEIHPAEKLLSAVQDTAERIAANAPIATRQAKAAISKATNLSLADGLSFEIEAYNRTVPTEDRREGVRAFNENRPPKFRGT